MTSQVFRHICWLTIKFSCTVSFKWLIISWQRCRMSSWSRSSATFPSTLGSAARKNWYYVDNNRRTNKQTNKHTNIRWGILPAIFQNWGRKWGIWNHQAVFLIRLMGRTWLMGHLRFPGRTPKWQTITLTNHRILQKIHRILQNPLT